MPDLDTHTIQLDLNYHKDIVNPSIELDQFDVADWLKGTTIPDEIDQLWVENYKANRNRIKPFPRLSVGKQKVSIHIGASPALKKNYQALREIDDNFILITSPTTLKFLLDEGIKPHYLFAIEGRKHWFDDFDCETEDLILIASPFIPPKALDKWKGKVFFYMISGGKEYDRLLRKDWESKVPLDTGGGNAISTSFLWSVKYLGCKKFVFCGMSFAYGDEYYHDGRPHTVDNTDEWRDWFQAMDIYGKPVNTTPTFISYKIWLESAIQSAVRHIPGIEFINATEEGILGVWPEPIGIENGQLLARRKFLPWLNIIPLAETIDAYTCMFKEVNENGFRF